MGNRIQSLAQELLGKSSLEECNTDEIKHLVHRHPYFAPAQFLLLQKLKEAGSAELEAQGRKAILYYHDPLQFEYFISSDLFSAETETEKQREAPGASVAESVADEHPVNSPFDFENVDNNTLPKVDISVPDASSSSLTGLAETTIEHSKINDEEITDELTASSSNSFKNNGGQNEIETIVDPAFHENESPSIPEETVEPQEVSQVSADVKKEESTSTASATAALSFEPYHMVDYFASQGIKFSAEELEKDKLGKQLKSFTAWLKTMKRLPSPQPVVATDTAAEKNIETMADRSLSDADIITEAMAEVWARQGATEKAVETYNKLSLIYPSKKAFFAGKIENLNRS